MAFVLTACLEKPMIIVTRDSDKKQFTSDMSSDEGICEIHFCTSYTQVKVQERTETTGQFAERDIICPPIGTEPSWLDEIAVQGDDTGVLTYA